MAVETKCNYPYGMCEEFASILDAVSHATVHGYPRPDTDEDLGDVHRWVERVANDTGEIPPCQEEQDKVNHSFGLACQAFCRRNFPVIK